MKAYPGNTDLSMPTIVIASRGLSAQMVSQWPQNGAMEKIVSWGYEDMATGFHQQDSKQMQAWSLHTHNYIIN